VSPGAEDDARSPAEERLLRHLAGLRSQAPEPSRELSASVIRTVRWQGSVRPYLVATGSLATGLAVAATAVLGGETTR
jgi:hypothetical protein